MAAIGIGLLWGKCMAALGWKRPGTYVCHGRNACWLGSDLIDTPEVHRCSVKLHNQRLLTNNLDSLACAYLAIVLLRPIPES